jgi:Predicted dehydrogenases and related proteins
MVCDSTEAGRAAAMQIAPNVPVVASLDEVTTGAVVIATPAATHYEIARHALETGRDVFVEKPLALTYAQGARLVQMHVNSAASSWSGMCSNIIRQWYG